MIGTRRSILLTPALAAALSASLVWTVLPAAAQDTKHFKPGEAPSADEVARILGGCESADNCDGVRTRQIMVRKKGQAAPPSGFSVPVQFELGSANLTPDALSSLAGIAAGLDKVLQANPQARIAIEGHADRSGEETLNKDLSARRAMAVRDYLSSRIQVPAESLQVQGFGSSRPIPGTDPYAGANRRVEFRRVQ